MDFVSEINHFQLFMKLYRKFSNTVSTSPAEVYLYGTFFSGKSRFDLMWRNE